MTPECWIFLTVTIGICAITYWLRPKSRLESKAVSLEVFVEDSLFAICNGTRNANDHLNDLYGSKVQFYRPLAINGENVIEFDISTTANESSEAECKIKVAPMEGNMVSSTTNEQFSRIKFKITAKDIV